jgi:hypothetical protein
MIQKPRQSIAVIVSVVLAMGMGSSTSLAAARVDAHSYCAAPSREYAWQAGFNGDVAWVQFVDRVKNRAILSFLRNPGNHAVETHLHDASAALQGRSDVPRFARFSLETGAGDATVAVDGIGTLQSFTDGKIGFSEGNTAYARDDGLRPHRKVLTKIHRSFRLWIDETVYCFPVSVEARKALKTMYAPLPSFEREVKQLPQLLPTLKK